MPYGYIPDQSFITPNILPRRSNRRPSGNFVDTYQMTPQQAQSAAQPLPNTGQINSGYVPQNTQFGGQAMAANRLADQIAAERAHTASGGYVRDLPGGNMATPEEMARQSAYNQWIAQRAGGGGLQPEGMDNLATQISGVDADGRPTYGKVSAGDARMAGQIALQDQRDREANMMSGDLGSRMARLQQGGGVQPYSPQAQATSSMAPGYAARVRDSFKRKMDRRGITEGDMESRRADYIARTDANSEWNRRSQRRGGANYVPNRPGPMMPGQDRVMLADNGRGIPTYRDMPAAGVPQDATQQEIVNAKKQEFADVLYNVFVDGGANKDEMADKLSQMSTYELEDVLSRRDTLLDEMSRGIGIAGGIGRIITGNEGKYRRQFLDLIRAELEKRKKSTKGNESDNTVPDIARSSTPPIYPATGVM